MILIVTLGGTLRHLGAITRRADSMEPGVAAGHQGRPGFDFIIFTNWYSQFYDGNLFDRTHLQLLIFLFYSYKDEIQRKRRGCYWLLAKEIKLVDCRSHGIKNSNK